MQSVLLYIMYILVLHLTLCTSYKASNTFSNKPNKICWDDNETPACIVNISSSPTTMENYCEKIEMKDEDKMRVSSISPISP